MARSMIRVVTLLWFSVLGFQPASAFGRDDVWVSGWGQGVSEAIITHGAGNQIYVTCNDGGSPFSGTEISFMLAGKAAMGSEVTLTFDGAAPERISIRDGAITSDCHACMASYEYVIGKLRGHTSVHVMFENGDSALFTLRGSAEAIVACTPDFAR